MTKIDLRVGDCLEILSKMDEDSVDCVVTSPPYFGLRNYEDNTKQIGLEETPSDYIDKLCEIFTEIKRVLKDTGTIWLNLGDTYTTTTKWGTKPKDLLGIPWAVAFALRDRVGLYLRQDIIWEKPNCMPESETDPCTKAHEYIFLFSKSQKYYFDHEAIQERCLTDEREFAYLYEENGSILQEQKNQTGKSTRRYSKKSMVMPGVGGKKYTQDDQSNNGKFATKSGKKFVRYGMRNKRSVWNVSTKSYTGAHFAVYPPDLIYPCIKAGCPQGGVVLDPFAGSGTTGIVAANNMRKSILIELNPEYAELIEKRCRDNGTLFIDLETPEDPEIPEYQQDYLNLENKK